MKRINYDQHCLYALTLQPPQRLPSVTAINDNVNVLYTCYQLVNLGNCLRISIKKHRLSVLLG